MAKPKRCPECGSDKIVRIVYGLVADPRDAVERGELLLGGCLVGPGSPRWGCAACRWQPPYDESADLQPAP